MFSARLVGGQNVVEENTMKIKLLVATMLLLVCSVGQAFELSVTGSSSVVNSIAFNYTPNDVFQATMRAYINASLLGDGVLKEWENKNRIEKMVRTTKSIRCYPSRDNHTNLHMYVEITWEITNGVRK